mmetsp:Transcript_38269/g.96941  ORF Transcript_38269/g.96941 Transcript_38269/m.96941 type:complete len:238 (-) Transcript_38269:186-899(-)
MRMSRAAEGWQGETVGQQQSLRSRHLKRRLLMTLAPPPQSCCSGSPRRLRPRLGAQSREPPPRLQPLRRRKGSHRRRSASGRVIRHMFPARLGRNRPGRRRMPLQPVPRMGLAPRITLWAQAGAVGLEVGGKGRGAGAGPERARQRIRRTSSRLTRDLGSQQNASLPCGSPRRLWPVMASLWVQSGGTVRAGLWSSSAAGGCLEWTVRQQGAAPAGLEAGSLCLVLEERAHSVTVEV